MHENKYYYELMLEKIRDLLRNGNPDIMLDGLEFLCDFTNEMGDINNKAEELISLFNEHRREIHPDERKASKIRMKARGLIDEIPKYLEAKRNISDFAKYFSQISFHNEEFLEAFVEDNCRNLSWLKKALENSRSICKVHINKKSKDPKKVGSGFIVSGNYLYTCCHVISSETVARNSVIEFNFEENANNQLMQPYYYNLDPDSLVKDELLDYAKVKIIDRDDFPLKNWGYLEIDGRKSFSSNEKLTIIHHPQGKVKHISLLGNVVGKKGATYFKRNHSIEYDASTEGGSSGSPVFNNDLKVIGIHRAGVKNVANSATLFFYIIQNEKKKM